MNSYIRSLYHTLFFLLIFSASSNGQHLQALQNQDGRMEIFVNDVYHIYQQDQGHPWSDWHSLLTQSLSFGSLAGKKNDGSLFLMELDLGSIITCFQVVPNGGWDYALTTLLSGLLNSDQASSAQYYTYAPNSDGTISFFIIGYDHTCWWIDKMNVSGQKTYKNFGGHDLRMITAATNQDGRNELFALGGDKVIYHRWQSTVNGEWDGWHTLGGHDIRSITTALNADGRLEVFAIGGNNVIYSISQVIANGGFGNWRTIGGHDIQQIVVRPNRDGRLELFALGSDQAVYNIWQVVPNGSFGNWNGLGGSKIKAIDIVKDRQGRLNLFALGSNSALYQKSQVIAGGGWPIPWNNLGTPTFGAGSSLPNHPQPAQTPPINVSFSTVPSSGYINIGATVRLVWNVKNCGNNCVVNLKGWNGLGYSTEILNKNTVAAGQLTIQPTETNTKYTITASGTNGSSNKSVDIAWAPNSGTAPSCTYFFFKMTGSSSVTPCFMTAVCAANLTAAIAKAQNESQGYTATQVTQQVFQNGCQ